MRTTKIKLHLLEFVKLATSAANEDANSLKSMFTKWEKIVPAAIIQRFIDSTRSDEPFEYSEVIKVDDSASIESFGLLTVINSNNI